VTLDPSRPVDANTPSAVLELLQAVCEQSPTGLLVFDEDLRYVLVNPQMATMANTPAEELLGRSVREAFPDYEALTTRVERVLATGEPLVSFDVSGTVPGEDGREHVWSLSAYRLVNASGKVLGVALTSNDVTAARTLELERAALANRLELLAASGELLSDGLDEQATVDSVLALVVPAVAEWACLHLVDESGAIRLAASRHADAAQQQLLERMLDGFEITAEQPFGAGRVIATGSAEDLPRMMDSTLSLDADDSDAMIDLRGSPGVVVPLAARGVTFGALSLSLRPDLEPRRAGVVGEAESLVARRELVSDVAARAALALDSARLYAGQHEVAVTLQRSLLPQSLPSLPGWDLAARYLPGAAGTEVGGDFYEAVIRLDGRLVFAIGDVMGRGVRAAAVMGQVRAALRGYALEGHSPATVLRRLNVMVTAMEDSSIVTCLVGTLDLSNGEVEMACAGHLPPVRASAAGACRVLSLDTVGPPLGVLGAQYGPTRTRVPIGGALVLFTDGLVEAREQPVDDGIATLCSILGDVLEPSAGDAASAEEVCAAAVAKMGRGDATVDDVAILAIRRT
jgi:PAS domain S-box-containing protein